ncbi:MAG: hypothetical protein ACU0CO_09365 [Shimia sp.]
MAGIVLRAATRTDAAWIVDVHSRLYAAECGFDASFGEAVRGIVDRFFAEDGGEGHAGWMA